MFGESHLEHLPHLVGQAVVIARYASVVIVGQAAAQPRGGFSFPFGVAGEAAPAAEDVLSERQITVRFNSDIEPALDW